MFVESQWINSDIKGDAKLWRYMDFTKLVSLLSTQSIFFCRSDNFRDTFEGKLFNQTDQDAFALLNRVMKMEEMSEYREYAEQIEIEQFKKELSIGLDEQRKKIFINCWHLNEYESAAMWDLYSNGKEGIAIQTTFDRVKKSLNACEDEVFIGKVKYLDNTTENNLKNHYIEPFFTKRVSFSHEQEVRFVSISSQYDVSDEHKIGKNIQVNLKDLIENVYVYPGAAPWFVAVVNVVLEKFNINIQVIPSDLYDIR